jgi:hypothetical protein
MKICAIMLSTGQDGTKRGSFPRLTPERTVAKPVLDLVWTRLPHNLRYYRETCPTTGRDPATIKLKQKEIYAPKS